MSPTASCIPSATASFAAARPNQAWAWRCSCIVTRTRRFALLNGESYVLTTGTGSGKSLAYFIPIVDHVLKHGGSGHGIEAIVVYPMNALANSQEEELHKFLTHGYGSGASPVSFARYTGQESSERKKEVIEHPPDILLTNFVMLELLLTRPDERRMVEAARGLEFLVLDELHTYRGRQGADVAMLIDLAVPWMMLRATRQRTDEGVVF